MAIAARSTNVKGFVHFGGDVVSGIDHGTGIVLGTASTAATPYLEPIADESNANIGIRAKGTGTITIGNSSNVISFGAGLTTPKLGVASTTAWTLVQRYVVQFTAPALAASTSVASTYTVTGLTTNSVLMFTPTNPISPAYTYMPYCSTANELVIHWGNIFGSTIGTGESTNRGILLQFS